MIKAAETVESTTDTSGVNAREIAQLIRRHWLVVFSVALIVFAGSAFLILGSPAVYKANAVIRISDRRGSFAGRMEGMPIQRVMGPQTDPILSDIQILKSRAVLARVIDEEGLRFHRIDGDLRDSLLYQPAIAPTARPDTVVLSFNRSGYVADNGVKKIRARYGEAVTISNATFAIQGYPGSERASLAILTGPQALEMVRRNLGALPREKTDVVDVEYLATDPHLAQRVVNAVVTTFNDLSSTDAQLEARTRREFLEGQLHHTDSIMVDAQNQLSRFRSREQLYSSQEKFVAQQTGLLNLDTEREKLAAERSVYTAVLSKLDGTPAERTAALDAIAASPAVAQNPVILRLNEQLGRYQTMRDSLTAMGSNRPNNPDVKRLDSLIAGSQERLAVAARSHVAFLGQRLNALDDLKLRNTQQLRTIPAAESEEVQLTQKLVSLKEIASQIREEYQKARVAEAIQVGEVEIVDLAERPVVPLTRARIPKLLFALLFGTILGTFVAFIIEHFNTSIARREDLESVLGLFGLAVVPRIGGRRARIPKRLRLWEAVGGRTNGNGKLRNGLVTLDEKQSPAAEAYRTLRTNLMFSSSLRRLRTLAVTSAAPGEGKTTTAGNLAVSLAQKGERVLLMDCDLRRPRIHELFGMSREPGLSSLLVESESIEETIRHSAIPGLDILTSGPIPFNPAELLASDHMRKLMEQLVESYDVVIIDAAPVLVAADASILARNTDGVLLVVSVGTTDRDAARAAVDQLRSVGANTIGAVLNDMNAKLPKHGMYAYTYSSYQNK